jgi:hypothetical protein
MEIVMNVEIAPNSGSLPTENSTVIECQRDADNILANNNCLPQSTFNEMR